MPTPRFARTDWLELSFQQLKQDGALSLTVENLCELAKKTRGSFYFHFENMDAFLLALAQEWKEQFTDAVTLETKGQISRNDLLNRLTACLDPQLETNIRQLAMIRTPIQQVILAADQQRINWLAGLYVSSGYCGKSEAQNLARIEYSAFVGFRMVNPDISDKEAYMLYKEFLGLTGRSASSRVRS